MQIDYMGKTIEVNLCKNSKQIEIDYAQSTVKLFFDQKAQCGQDGKRIVIASFFLCTLHNFVFLCSFFGM